MIQKLGSRLHSEMELLLELPKMKVDSVFELNGPLTEIGIRHLFSPSANLSGVVVEDIDATDIKVLHQCHFEINENGLVAAATTGMYILFVLSLFFIFI